MLNLRKYHSPYFHTGWGKLNEYNRWSEIYGSDDDSWRNWSIYLMSPEVGYSSGLILVCIKTISEFRKDESDENCEYRIGLITRPELFLLKNGLITLEQR